MGNTINKKTIWALIIIVALIFAGTSSTRLKFGNVILKDTLSGSLKVTSGGIHVDATDSINCGAVAITVGALTGLSGGIFFSSANVYIDDDGNDLKYATQNSGGHFFNDNVTIDSILTLRQGTTVTLESDDSLVTVTSSCMILNSDDATSTNRTFTISDGATTGQLLIIEWLGAVGSKEGEIIDAGSESGLNGTMTFDALDDTIMLKWTGTYWRELSRTEH